MDAENISRSSSTYIGKLRSNFLGTKFIIYDTQPPHPGSHLPPSGRSSLRFTSKRVSPKLPSGSYNIAHIKYELNVLGPRGPRRMHCIMHSIPATSLNPGGYVPSQLSDPGSIPRQLGDSFRRVSLDRSTEFESSRFSKLGDDVDKVRPMVLKNKLPRWHEQLQCWCLNFRGRVTVALVKSFQLVAATGSTPAGGPLGSDHDKVILQFGKVGKDMFTMDYSYPLSAFQAFAI